MKIKYFLTILISIITAGVYAQTGRQISGVVKDSTGTTLPGSTVKLLTGTDSTSMATDANGRFSFPAVKVKQFSLVVQSIGYQPLRRRIVLDNDTKPVVLAPIILKSESITLKGVTITETIPMKIKEDTVEYNAAAYKVRENAPVEDALKKLPGVDVDKDGNVTAQGKTVTKVRVNGKDFFGGDVKTATKNLSADMVQSYQIVDDYGDQANITGVKSGEPEKVLNINIKPSKNYGYFGSGTAGGGQDAIPTKDNIGPQNRNVAGVTGFSFSGDRQLSLLANLNNTNTNLFSFGGPPGGGRGGGPGGPPGGGNNNNNGGITTARSIGFNYRDSWGKKITAYGSFSYADNDIYTVSKTSQNNTSLTDPSVNNSNSTQNAENKNLRFNYNIEYKPDTVNYIKIIPTITYFGVNSTQTGTSNLAANDQTISAYNYTSAVNSNSPSYGTSVLYNHRFSKKGRNFSVLTGLGTYHSNQYQNPVYTYTAGVPNAPLNQNINTTSHTDSLGASFSYLEPVGKVSYVEFNYNYHNAYTTADKLTDTLTAENVSNKYDLLSNSYNYTFVTNRFGVNYRVIEKKYNYTIGLAAQPTLLNGYSPTTGQRTHVTTFNIAPTARYIYNFSRNQSLSVNYSGGSTQPVYSVLQPVIDFSNSSYPVQGNPDLKPEFSNNLSLRYNKFDFMSGNVFFSNLQFTQTDNKIVANTTTFPRYYAPNPKLSGTILTQYQNADGFYQGSAFYLFAKPWQKRKYTLFFNGNFTYNNAISYISSVDSASYAITKQKNLGRNLIATQGTRFRVSITDVIDADVNASYSINHSNNTIHQPNVIDNFQTLNLGVSGKNYVWKNWTLSYDYTKTFYEGYKGATNPNILNAYVERRFLKDNSAMIRFSAFDLFNQNTGYASTQNGTYITQTNTNRLGRYYLLTFTLRLQKFAGKRPEGPMGGPGFRGGPGGPPPGGGPGGS